MQNIGLFGHSYCLHSVSQYDIMDEALCSEASALQFMVIGTRNTDVPPPLQIQIRHRT